MTEPSQEELSEILHEFASWFPWRPEDLKAHHYEKAEEEAKSAINSLTLKQVLSLIGEDEDRALRPAKSLVRNDLRAELRQEAEKRFGDG